MQDVQQTQGDDPTTAFLQHFISCKYQQFKHFRMELAEQSTAFCSGERSRLSFFNERRSAVYFCYHAERYRGTRKSCYHVERINGPILLLSATNDEICPSVQMAEKMMSVLKKNHFKYPYKHISMEGSHAAPLQHMDTVIEFIQQNMPVK